MLEHASRLPFKRPEYPSDKDAEQKFLRVIDALGITDPHALARERLQSLGLVLPEDFFKGPHLHGPHSQAVYDGDGVISSPSIDPESDFHMDHRILTTVMEQGGRSSLHEHIVYSQEHPAQKRPMHEVYIGIKGELDIHQLRLHEGVIVGQVKHTITPGNIFVIDPGSPHYVVARNGHSYTAIIMRNGGNVPEPQHHIPLVAKLPGEHLPRVITSAEVSQRVPLIES